MHRPIDPKDHEAPLESSLRVKRADSTKHVKERAEAGRAGPHLADWLRAREPVRMGAARGRSNRHVVSLSDAGTGRTGRLVDVRALAVEGRWPERNAAIALTSWAASRPTSRGTAVSALRVAGWHPEQAAAPGGGASAPKATLLANSGSAASIMHIVRMRVPP